MATYYYTAFEQSGDALLETMMIDRGGEKAIEVYGRQPGADKWNRGRNIPRDAFPDEARYEDHIITAERAAELGFSLSDYEGTEATDLTAEEIVEAEVEFTAEKAGHSVLNPKPKAGSRRQWNIAVIIGAIFGVYLALD